MLFEDELADNGSAMLTAKVVCGRNMFYMKMYRVGYPYVYVCRCSICIQLKNNSVSVYTCTPIPTSIHTQLHIYTCTSHTLTLVAQRVMPSCFFALVRFAMRVDDVLFRIIDTRVFHRFQTPFIVREISNREATYEALGEVLRYCCCSACNGVVTVIIINPVVALLRL